MAQSEFSKRLAKMSGLWNKAAKRDPKASNFECPVEDGIYKARLTSLSLGESAGKGRLQVSWAWTIAEGDGKGEQVRDYDGLETEDNFFYLQKKIAQLGKEIPSDPSEVEAILKELLKEKPLARIKIKTTPGKDGGNDFTHIYINRLLNEQGEEVETATPEGAEPEPEAEGAEAGGEEPTPEPEPEAEPAAEPEEPQPEPEEPQPEAEAEPEPTPEPEPEEVRLELGMRVTFALSGKDVEGDILEFVEENTKARVKTDKGVFKLKIEALTPKPGEEAPTPAPPPAKPAKGTVRQQTPAPKPAPAAPPKKGPGRPPKAVPAKK